MTPQRGNCTCMLMVSRLYPPPLLTFRQTTVTGDAHERAVSFLIGIARGVQRFAGLDGVRDAGNWVSDKAQKTVDALTFWN